MLGKLLKYDLKYMIKNMSIFYILAIFFAVLTRILYSLETSVILNIITSISLGCMISSVIINTMMRSWVRFKDSVYKDESYLTHTLPVSKNDIYNSKFLETLIFFVISFIVVLVCLFITFYSKENWLIIKTYVNTITTGLEFNTLLFVICAIVIVFLELYNAINCGFLGLILGYKKNNNKTAFSVLFGFIAYLVSQSIVLFLVFVVGLFDESVMMLFRNNVAFDTGSFKMLILLSIIFYILSITVMSIICKKELNKGVNIE